MTSAQKDLPLVAGSDFRILIQYYDSIVPARFNDNEDFIFSIMLSIKNKVYYLDSNGNSCDYKIGFSSRDGTGVRVDRFPDNEFDTIPTYFEGWIEVFIPKEITSKFKYINQNDKLALSDLNDKYIYKLELKGNRILYGKLNIIL